MIFGNKNSVWGTFTPAIGTNTFIGGIQGTTNTASALATLLEINQSNIENFAITIDGIECFININYTIPFRCFDSNTEITSYLDYSGKVTSLGSEAFGTNTAEEVGTPNLTHAYFPECIHIGDICFGKGGLKKEVIYLPKCVSIGTSVLIEFTFWYGSFNNCVLYVDPFLQTCNSGGVEGDIAYNLAYAPYAFKDVRYVANFTVPNPITDLAVDTVYITAIDLTWSEPTSVNAIDYYEVYVDGILYDTITETTITVFDLTNLATYNFTVKAVDIFYNRSDSNLITQQINGVINPVFSDPTAFISYYNFNDNVLDSVGTNDGTPTDITYVSGVSGNSAFFNGTTSIVKMVSSASNLDFNGVDFSVSQFFKTTQSTGYRLLQNRGQGAATIKGWQISPAFSGNYSNTWIADGSGVYINFSDIPYNEDDNIWHNLIMTWETATGTAKIYIDAVLKSTKTEASFIGANLNGLDLTCGGSNTDGQLFNGSVDSGAIFNKALSQEEVTEIYNLQNNSFELI